jgi:hypothetical protein
MNIGRTLPILMLCCVEFYSNLRSFDYFPFTSTRGTRKTSSAPTSAFEGSVCRSRDSSILLTEIRGCPNLGEGG